MAKARFGELLQKARSAKGMSLRELSAQTGIEFSRLSRMEHGTRPAPGLPHMRRLAELLSLDLVELLVSAGTPREAVEQLLWAERMQQAKRIKGLADYRPLEHPSSEKNGFLVSVLSREGALCRVELGTETWILLSFSDADRLRVFIPPQAIQLFRESPERVLVSRSNVFRAQINKLREVGPLMNPVIDVGGIELNGLMMCVEKGSIELRTGEQIYVSIPPAAIRTEPVTG